eukprot:2350996-Pleurochrysis_carterae.AAC.3
MAVQISGCDKPARKLAHGVQDSHPPICRAACCFHVLCRIHAHLHIIADDVYRRFPSSCDDGIVSALLLEVIITSGESNQIQRRAPVPRIFCSYTLKLRTRNPCVIIIVDQLPNAHLTRMQQGWLRATANSISGQCVSRRVQTLFLPYHHTHTETSKPP